MKIKIQGLSHRTDHSGWSVFYKGSTTPIDGIAYTTREEARTARKSINKGQLDMFSSTYVDKVRVTMKVEVL